jgi:hypothetical protein
MNTNIESHLTENRKFKSRKSFSKHAHISSFERYEKLYRKSIKDPQAILGEAGVGPASLA